MKILKVLGVTAALALAAPAAQASVIYTDGASDFHGLYRGVGTLMVGFGAAAGSSAISFDLFGANSVDGFGNSYDDLFSIAVNGTTVFEGYFNMAGGGDNSVVTNALGWAWATATNVGGNFAGGVTSVSGLVNLVSGYNTISFAFTSPGPSNGGDQGLDDESWALNNLDISAVPVPATLPLLAAGMAGFGLMRRRKQ